MKIAFVGGGAMCEATLAGIIASGLAPPDSIAVGEPIAERRKALEDRHGVRTSSENASAIVDADLIVLSVKPQSLSSALTDLAGALDPRQALASIVAGAKLSTLAKGTGHEAIIRVMPNTPAQVREGMTVWTCSQGVTSAQRSIARSVLATLGEELEVDSEDLIDMATALSASGPAYVFSFIEALIDGGVAIGIPRPLASRMAMQTVLGSTRMAIETGDHPAHLRNTVTSPGGTTAAALVKLESGSFRATVMEAVAAAHRRARELGEDA